MTAADIDLRGFDYPLAALLEQARWTSDALQGRAARALASLQTLRAQLQQVEQSCQQQRQHLTDSAQRYLDPALHRRALNYLLHMRNTMAALHEKIDAAQTAHQQLLDQCVRQQLRIDMFETHQRQQRDDYAMAQRARQATALDHAWIARSQWLDTSREEERL